MSEMRERERNEERSERKRKTLNTRSRAAKTPLLIRLSMHVSLITSLLQCAHRSPFSHSHIIGRRRNVGAGF